MRDEKKPDSVSDSSLIPRPSSLNTRVEQLLEEIFGSERTPEEVCVDCPELLAEVHKRWQQLRFVKAELTAMFPAAKPNRDSDTPTPLNPAAELPHIPGYQVEAVVGRGGMGIVYKALHLRLNRPVALKMLLAGAYAGLPERERFIREAESVASLRHANLVQIYDVGEHDGRPYFTMEYVDGGSLAQKLMGTPQCVHYAAACVATIAEAVQVAHLGGIVHRDLKPANILLSPKPNFAVRNPQQNPSYKQEGPKPANRPVSDLGNAGVRVASELDCRVSDFDPKIADFGLARHFERDSGLTLSGTQVGTPSYMAPEQALGKTHGIGPAADIYSRGAVLYELITGRPPFKGETPTETQLQVMHYNPVPPSRLNPRVPRDLETICLKCLEKEPARRYPTAGALADDLRRLEDGRPIKARPVGWAERSWRWCRRKPASAALIAALLVLVLLSASGGLWFVQQRARHEGELRSDVSTAIDQAGSLRDGFHFRQARELLDQARQRLEPAGPANLRRLVEQERVNLDLMENLDKARLLAASPVVAGFDTVGVESLQAESLYEETLAKAGLGGPGNDSEAVAARVRDSARCAEIVAALDDWASITADPARRAWLLAVARKADPDPIRDRLRQPELWDDGPGLTKLVKELTLERLSPQLTTALGRVLLKNRGEAVELLSAAQARHPQDFWLNFDLGSALYLSRRSDEALGFYRAALALRPEAAAHCGVGETLGVLGRWDEAIGHFNQALAIDLNFATAHCSLAWALQAKGRQDEAISHYQEAIRIDPRRSAGAHNNLGLALHAKGQLLEAISHFQESIRLDPKASATAHYNLGLALREKGRLDEAIDHLRQTIKLEPTSTKAPSSLASALFQAARADVGAAADQGSKAGQLSESERADKRRQALARLRANLELRTKLQNEGKAVAWSVAVWQTDPALAGVREPAALAKLPDAERAEWQRLWADVAAIVAADPRVQGEAFGARRDLAKAADGYAQALKRVPTDDGHFWFEYAALLLLSGDRAGYEKACAHMIETCGKPGGPRSYHVARACTLAPDAVADVAMPGRLAETELQVSAKQFWSLTEQGALAYRAGRFQESVALFEQSLRADATPGRAVVTWVWLALAQQRLGKAEEARRWLSNAQAWLDQYRDGMPADAEEKVGLHLHNWLEANVLRREAEALIQPKASAAQSKSD